MQDRLQTTALNANRETQREAGSDFALALRGYRLTTAEIIYHLPDHPGLLQSFVWQEYDHPPRFPRLHKFLDFWAHNLDGLLHSVSVMHAGTVSPQPVRIARTELRLH